MSLTSCSKRSSSRHIRHWLTRRVYAVGNIRVDLITIGVPGSFAISGFPVTFGLSPRQDIWCEPVICRVQSWAITRQARCVLSCNFILELYSIIVVWLERILGELLLPRCTIDTGGNNKTRDGDLIMLTVRNANLDLIFDEKETSSWVCACV